MRIKLASLVIIVAMISSLGGTSVFAKTSDPATRVVETQPSSDSSPVARKNPSTDDKMKADMLKLVADAKAGKVAPRTAPQLPRSKRNNLSTGAKIGIVAAIAGLIFALVVIQKLNSDDD